MEAPTIQSARQYRGDLLEPLVLLRRALHERGENLPPDWPEQAEGELRSGKLLGWVVAQGNLPPKGLALLALRSHRGFGQMHLWEGVDPKDGAVGLARTLLGSLPSTVRRIDLSLSAEDPALEGSVVGLLQPAGLDLELVTRLSMSLSLDVQNPPAGLPVPPGYRFVPALALAVPLLAQVDFRAFEGGPDAGLVAETPEDNQRLLEGLLRGDLGAPLREGSPALLQDQDESHAHLVGFVLALEESPHRALIADVAVLPDHRRRGLGQALLARSLRGLVALGFSQVTLWVTQANEPARKLYERLGFRVDGQGHILRWTRPGGAPAVPSGNPPA